MNQLDWHYQALLSDILDLGEVREDRTGTGTISIFGQQLRHDMSKGFPLLTTKRLYFKGIVTELLWFLRGDTNIKFLHDNKCHIWDGDYAKSGRTDGELGPIYGKQWRNWDGNDQIEELVYNIKNNPTSRRLIVNAWNVSELHQMTLPPCHVLFQCYVKNGKYLSLMMYQRSADIFLGLPFNLASYGLLLTLLAKETEMIPDELIINIGDAHLYMNHLEQANEQIKRKPFGLPQIKVNKGIDASFDDIKLMKYMSHSSIKAPLSN